MHPFTNEGRSPLFLQMGISGLPKFGPDSGKASPALHRGPSLTAALILPSASLQEQGHIAPLSSNAIGIANSTMLSECPPPGKRLQTTSGMSPLETPHGTGGTPSIDSGNANSVNSSFHLMSNNPNENPNKYCEAELHFRDALENQIKVNIEELCEGGSRGAFPALGTVVSVVLASVPRKFGEVL